MASKKDMRREDLIVPYMEPAVQKNEGDIQGTMASTLPMAAIFTRNKMIGWTSLIFSVQGWLSETPETKKNAATPAYFSIGMALMALGVCYMQLFLPPPPGARVGVGSGTEAPAAIPNP